MSIPLPDELTKHSDIDKCIESVSSNMKDYFPSIDTKSDVWRNINAVINHARHAYQTLKNEHCQLEEADFKIKDLEEQLKKWRNKLNQITLNIVQKGI